MNQPGRYCEEHHRYECTKRRKRGGDCHGSALRGLDACRLHAGKTSEDARRDGQINLARLYGTALDVTPIEALLDQVRWSAGHVAALRQLLNVIADGATTDPPAESLWWGTSRTVTLAGGGIETTEIAAPHIILTAYDKERDRLARLCQAAVAAGAQQQMVDQARRMGQIFSRLLDLLLPRLQLAPWQFDLLPEVLPEVLRELPDDDTTG